MSIELDGFTLLEAETPGSPEELSDTVKRAAQAGKVMIPVGGAQSYTWEIDQGPRTSLCKAAGCEGWLNTNPII